MGSEPVKRALISVSNKLGIVDFAKGLVENGVEILSTGGTRRHLEQAGVEVRDVADYTEFPEMMDGRVKTLHPKIFAGILARRNRPDDLESMDAHDIVPIDLVVVNLYPFAATIAKPGVKQEEAIEQIDIGGPSLVRAAAKNSDYVTVVSDPNQYAEVLDTINRDGNTSLELRRRLMAQAFQHTAYYDLTIADYFSSQTEGDVFPATMTLVMSRKSVLRYGENSHQRAAVYRQEGSRDACLVNSRQLHGKELSYNNLLDLDSALNIVRGFEQPACSVIKHNNPCGAAVSESVVDAVRKGFAGDPISAFGSVIGLNRGVDRETAEFLAGEDFFVEAIVAPGFDDDALEILVTKPKWRKNVRLLKVGDLDPRQTTWELRQLVGGVLVQDSDTVLDEPDRWKVATKNAPSDDLMAELEFAWAMVRHVKSNAILLAKDQSLVGVGAGQMSRVDSVNFSIQKAGAERAKGSVLASDAFFPFADSIAQAAEAGVVAIIQPGGSIRDQEVIDACDEHGIPMVLTGRRHFRH